MILLDTSGLLSLVFQEEPFHEQATAYFSRRQWLFTTDLILAELVALGTIRKYPRLPVLDFIDDLLAHKHLKMVWSDAGRHHSARDLLRLRMDKTYSLCDALSFVIMRQFGIQSALTNDKHFEQEGFERLLKN